MDVKIENWARRSFYRGILISNAISTINEQLALIIGNCNYVSKACIRID